MYHAGDQVTDKTIWLYFLNGLVNYEVAALWERADGMRRTEIEWEQHNGSDEWEPVIASKQDGSNLPLSYLVHIFKINYKHVLRWFNDSSSNMMHIYSFAYLLSNHLDSNQACLHRTTLLCTPMDNKSFAFAYRHAMRCIGHPSFGRCNLSGRINVHNRNKLPQLEDYITLMRMFGQPSRWAERPSGWTARDDWAFKRRMFKDDIDEFDRLIEAISTDLGMATNTVRALDNEWGTKYLQVQFALNSVGMLRPRY